MVQFVKNLLFDLGFSHVWTNQCTFNSSALFHSVKNKLKERFILFWKKRLLADEGIKKLRTYKLLKENFGIEPYLEILHDKKLRQSLCSFRISAHRLRIEQGRYCGAKPEERLCDICNFSVENEIHFLCSCKKYDGLRSKMINTIKDNNSLLNRDEEKTFITLMTSTDNCIIKAVANFVLESGIS